MHCLEHRPRPLRTRAITWPLAIGAELTGDHELIIRSTLGLALPLPLLQAGATHVLGKYD
jgi:hypothetical protein